MLSQMLKQVLYPLGLLANLCFGSAFTLQWWQNKAYKTSQVPKFFWKISSLGAILMILHGFIQNQYPIAMLYTINLVIYFRNLNILSAHPISFQKTLTAIILAPALVLLSFFISVYFDPSTQWIAAPNLPHIPRVSINIYWHVLGNFGLLIFSARFLFQWYFVEQGHKSEIPKIFWKMSLVGGSLSLIYFIRLKDPVNILSYSCGLFPPLANFYLLYKRKDTQQYATNHCFLSAGETSGDILGGNLIRVIKSLHPKKIFSGIGGPCMRAQGLTPIINSEEFHVSGFSEVFTTLFSLFKKYRKTLKTILKEKPETVVCIDFPDFHSYLIQGLRKRGYKGKIIQYVCPTIWAWRSKRKRFLEKYLDALLVIFPFEKELFSDSSLNTVYLGHPLVDAIANHQYDSSWKDNFPISSRPIIAAFPGSRRGDIKRNLKVQVRAFLFSSLKNTHQLLISSSSPQNDEIIQAVLKEEHCEHAVIIPATLRYELMHESDCALAKCGTIVLETALTQTPTIVTCQLRALDSFLAKYVFKIFLPAYSLPNIIMKSIIFPEFIGDRTDFHPEEVASALELLMQGKHREEQKVACEKLRHIMTTNVVSPQEFLCSFYDIPTSHFSL